VPAAGDGGLAAGRVTRLRLDAKELIPMSAERLDRRHALGFVAAATAALAGFAGVALARRGGQTASEATAPGGPDRPPALVQVEPHEPTTGPAAAATDAERSSALPVFYSPAYALAAHSFETTRKARWVADSLEREPLPRLELLAPDPLTEAEVKTVHAAR
jgi:hypothetical protein